jgi:hypothetical protein
MPVAASSVDPDFVSSPVTIDFSRSNQRICITASAPVTLGGPGFNPNATVKLSLYRNGDDALLDVSTCLVNSSSGFSAVTPALVHQVAPGVYYAELEITGQWYSVVGRINISASVAALAV